ncbi:MAG: hypothetical protein ACK4UU_09235, partial [Fimbriimonadales bacterium]
MKPTSTSMTREQRTPLERRLAERFRHAPLGQCLKFEEFMALAQQGRRAKGYHQHMEHLVSCPACRRAYLELRALLGVQRFSWARWFKRLSIPQFPQWVLATGVAASVFALAVWTLYPRATNPATIATQPETPSRTQLAQNLETPTQKERAAETHRPSGEGVSSPATTPDSKVQQNLSRTEKRGSQLRTIPSASQPKQAPRSGGSGATQLARTPTESKPRTPHAGNPVANDANEGQQVAVATNNATTNRPEPPATTAPPRENLAPIERELASVG